MLLVFIGMSICLAIFKELRWVYKYISLIHTLIHEFCHGLGAFVTGGRLQKIQLFNNTSGLAFSRHRSKFGAAFTAYMGYTGASLVVILFGYLRFIGYGYVTLMILSVVVILSTLFWLRNWFGWFWGVSLSGLFVYLHIHHADSGFLYDLLPTFLLAFLMVDTILGALTIYKLSYKQPLEAGDATSLAKYTRVPAPFWGFLFLVQSVGAIVLVWKYFM